MDHFRNFRTILEFFHRNQVKNRVNDLPYFVSKLTITTFSQFCHDGDAIVTDTPLPWMVSVWQGGEFIFAQNNIDR